MYYALTLIDLGKENKTTYFLHLLQHKEEFQKLVLPNIHPFQLAYHKLGTCMMTSPKFLNKQCLFQESLEKKKMWRLIITNSKGTKTVNLVFTMYHIGQVTYPLHSSISFHKWG